MPLPVILSGAREERILPVTDGRGVEGSRRSVPRGAVPGRSPQTVSCEIPDAAHKLEILSGSFDSPPSQSSLGFAQDDSRTKHLGGKIRAVALTVLFVLSACISAVFLATIRADSKPAVQLNVDHAAPRDVSDTVQQALVRDYSAAWQALAVALADNNASTLNDNFIGFAQDQLTQRIKDQQQAGLRTRIVDRGHNVEAVFYSTEGAAIELRDTATLETQILDGETVIHAERAQVRYYVIMTGAEDRWKVRVLASAPGQQ